MSNKIKHLDLIQAVINRMASNSFIVKGWAITLASAALALGADKEADARFAFTFISVIPIVAFWILDGYFIWQERVFRSFYDEIAQKEEAEHWDFRMRLGPYFNKPARNTWIASVFSKTLNFFYIPLLVLAMTVATATYLNSGKPEEPKPNPPCKCECSYPAPPAK